LRHSADIENLTTLSCPSLQKSPQRCSHVSWLVTW